MKEIINYVTDDGEIFDDYNKAEQHEHEILMGKFNNVIHLYDSNEEEISLNDRASWDAAYFAYFTGSLENADEFFNIWNKHCDSSCPINKDKYKKGLYVYEVDIGEWLFVPDTIKFYTDMNKKFVNRFYLK